MHFKININVCVECLLLDAIFFETLISLFCFKETRFGNSTCIDHKYCKALDVKSPFVKRKNKTDKKDANISKKCI